MLVFIGDEIYLKLSHSRLRFAGGADKRCSSQEKDSFQN